ncbi:MAG: ubiquitin-like domain-containing protein [Anaerolineae bacterium]|nr:ubiquitin-like domain-containing protein [Thermoflexales bacterium]MCX7939335.1 ubiquitin-like domain-containing protein [Thermoflexales bacterium]MDW8053105.1 ubiquitin-like domain-containing protein [Anaerolineae bacterium]
MTLAGELRRLAAATVLTFQRRGWLSLLVLAGLLALLALSYLSSLKPVRIVDGARVIELRTLQPTIEGVLREAGVALHPEDRVLPPPSASVSRDAQVVIQRARLIRLQIDEEAPRLLRTQHTNVRDLLAEVGLVLSVDDAVRINGRFEERLPAQAKNDGTVDAEVVVRRGVPVVIREIGGGEQRIKTAAHTVGEALLEAGYVVYLADAVKPSLSSPIRPNMEIILERAKPVTLWVDGRPIRTRTLQPKVEDVLAEMGIALIGEDYAIPSLSTPVQPDMQIRVVRVQRELRVQQTPIPFETLWEPDPELELDTEVLAQEGVPGIRERRSLVTLEDGLEVRSELVADFVARPPLPRIYKYGTKVVIRTLETPNGPLQYWRKLRMFATSYSASTAGVPRSSPWYGRTRCGQPMRFGIVAVDPRVIPLGTNVYVPGYGQGLACDTGSAIIGKRIDLGYDDSNLRLWRAWVDVYLLPPVPQNIRYRLN